MPEARAVGPTTAQEIAFSRVSTPMPAQRERAVELVVKMGMTVRIISRSSSSIMGTSAIGSSMSRLTPPTWFIE